MTDYSSPIDSVSLFDECVDISRGGAELFFIGRTVLGVPIPCLAVGSGASYSLFVGAHHGMESITANVLLKYAAEFTPRGRKLYIVPMLNIDGCAIAAVRGVRWQANARGVDINHNYDAGFDLCKAAERAAGIFSPAPTKYGGEFPESEPETAAMCALVRRLSPNLKTVVALHTQGEEIYFDYGGMCPEGAKGLAERFSAASGYALSRPDGTASHGGFKDWVIDKFGIPAFTIECGRGENPLPPSDFSEIYEKVRPILDIAAAF